MANSLEEIMQRRLKDYLQSSGTIFGYVEDFENLFTELEASGYSVTNIASRAEVAARGLRHLPPPLPFLPELDGSGLFASRGEMPRRCRVPGDKRRAGINAPLPAAASSVRS
ncbi:hypothetical protein R5R35_001704 [Gryllus longicercus]|uniref:Uncharacterized protein n=1 Tax=Gryllus longicercus TaxID=2509291 RepID=A0AAN9W1Q9_9ORTH